MGIPETTYAAACDLSAVLQRRGESAAQRRLMTFRTRVNDDYQCPSCWMRNEVQSPLNAVPGTAHEDKMRCRVCGAEFVIALGG